MKQKRLLCLYGWPHVQCAGSYLSWQLAAAGLPCSSLALPGCHKPSAGGAGSQLRCGGWLAALKINGYPLASASASWYPGGYLLSLAQRRLAPLGGACISYRAGVLKK